MGVPPDWADDFFTGLWLEAQGQMWSDEESDHDAQACVEHLGLEPGASILDIPCGEGRIAVRLAANGFEVTGVDRNARLLEAANDLARRVEVDVTFECADMRHWRASRSFDGAVCLWGSIGYGSEEDDRALFSGIHAALRPGGALVLDTHVLETLLPQFTPSAWYEAGDISVVERRSFDPQTSRVESEWLLTRGGAIEHRRSSIRIYAYRELCNLLNSIGFSDFAGCGSTQLEPFEMGSPRLFLRAGRSR